MLGPGAGDNAAAALGLGAVPGDVVVSIGTSGVACAVSEVPTADPTGTIAGFASATGEHLPLVCTLNAARVLDATAALLGVDHDRLAELALNAPAGAGGLTLVPYLEGERTPNRPDATGALHGLTLGTAHREHLARAAVEGLLCGLADAVDALEVAGVPVRRVFLVGGGARSAAVQAIAPAVLGRPVVVPAPGEYVADGAARQAAWVLRGELPEWEPAGTVVREADPTPAVRRPLRRGPRPHRGPGVTPHRAPRTQVRGAAHRSRPACRPVILGASRGRRPGVAVTASRPAGQHTVRRHNRALVLRTVAADEPVSRARIAAGTGLTRGTVSSLVEELLAAGLVAELAAARGATGRPASPLQLNRSGPGGLGVEIGVDAVGACVVDLTGAVRAQRIAASGHRTRPVADGLRAAAGLAAEVVAEAGLPIAGVGLAVPGVVADGVLERAPNLPLWRDVDVVARAAAVLAPVVGDAPVSVGNEADLAALAEHRAGAAGDDFLYVSGGIGVGAGIVLGGRLFGGSGGRAGELGHVVVDPAGPPCTCGGQRMPRARGRARGPVPRRGGRRPRRPRRRRGPARAHRGGGAAGGVVTRWASRSRGR